MPRAPRLLVVLLLVMPALVLPRLAGAEVSVVTLPSQHGIAFIPFLLIKDDKLTKKHAATVELPKAEGEMGGDVWCRAGE